MEIQRDFKYKGIPVQQNPLAFQEFENFFNQEKFDYVIEIGTSYGGLSLFLYEQSLVHKFKFITYDISTVRVEAKWQDPVPFDFRVEDCFSDKTKADIIKILKSKKCLVLCDGGDKPKEFNLFGEFLSKGSYIMGHDYSPNRNYFDEITKRKVWKWFEIQDSDVKEVMDAYNIKKSDYFEKFRDVAWISCIKE